MDKLNVTEQAILRKRRTDDEAKNARLDTRFKNKRNQNKKAKANTKKEKVLVPEVFVSNFKKQQRSFVQYKRHKIQSDRGAIGDLPQLNQLVLVIRIRQSANTAP